MNKTSKLACLMLSLTAPILPGATAVTSMLPNSTLSRGPLNFIQGQLKSLKNASLVDQLLLGGGAAYYLWNFNNVNSAIADTGHKLLHDLSDPREVTVMGSVGSLILLKAYVEKKPGESFATPLKKSFGELIAFASIRALAATPAFSDFYSALTTSYDNCRLEYDEKKYVLQKNQKPAQKAFLKLKPMAYKEPNNNEEKCYRLGRTLILAGGTGTGKTTILHTYLKDNKDTVLAFTLPREFVSNPAEMMRQRKYLIKWFERLHNKTGKDIIIFIDEIDSLIPNRLAKGVSGLGQLAAASFLGFIDELFSTTDVTKHDWLHIVGATNALRNIDPAQLSRFLNGPGPKGIGGGYGTRNKEMLFAYIDFDENKKAPKSQAKSLTKQVTKNFRTKENKKAAQQEDEFTEEEVGEAEDELEILLEDLD